LAEVLPDINNSQQNLLTEKADEKSRNVFTFIDSFMNKHAPKTNFRN